MRNIIKLSNLILICFCCMQSCIIDDSTEKDISLRGTVTDKNNVPISEAEILIKFLDKEISTQTNSNGEYFFSSVNHGSCIITIKAHDYLNKKHLFAFTGHSTDNVLDFKMNQTNSATPFYKINKNTIPTWVDVNGASFEIEIETNVPIYIQSSDSWIECKIEETEKENTIYKITGTVSSNPTGANRNGTIILESEYISIPAFYINQSRTTVL